MTTHYLNPFHAYITLEMRTVIEMHHLLHQPKMKNAYRWQDDAFTTVAKMQVMGAKLSCANDVQRRNM